MPFRLIAALAATCALFVSSLIVAPPASAVTLEINYAVDFSGTVVCNGRVTTGGLDVAGTGCFRNDGDQVIVTDDAYDSQRVGVHWRLRDGSRRGLCINKDGNGSRRWCNKDFPESQDIQLRVGLCDGSVHVCETLADYNSWSPWGAYTPVG